MDLGGDGASVYAEAKSEYTKQLCQYLVPSIQQYFLDLLEEAKQKESDPKRVLVMFQTLMEDISDWNVDKVQRETNTIATGSQCDYLDELMTAVFIAHTKVLSAIRLTTKQKKLQITIPKLDHFIHRILRECSRLLWSNTFLFSSMSPSMERQKNFRLIENCIQEGVLQGIRSMLPVKNILREYLKEDDEEDVLADGAEEEVDNVQEKSEVKVEPEVEPEPEPKADPKPEPKADPKPEPKADPKPEPKPASKSEPKPASKTDSKVHSEEKSIPAASPISFTGNDTLDEIDSFEDMIAIGDQDQEDQEDQEEINILDAPPEPMDDFEDLEKPDKGAEETTLEDLQMDFETLD
jgi:hypothetical protein